MDLCFVSAERRYLKIVSRRAKRGCENFTQIGQATVVLVRSPKSTRSRTISRHKVRCSVVDKNVVTCTMVQSDEWMNVVQ